MEKGGKEEEKRETEEKPGGEAVEKEDERVRGGA